MYFHTYTLTYTDTTMNSTTSLQVDKLHLCSHRQTGSPSGADLHLRFTLHVLETMVATCFFRCFNQNVWPQMFEKTSPGSQVKKRYVCQHQYQLKNPANFMDGAPNICQSDSKLSHPQSHVGASQLEDPAWRMIIPVRSS